MGILARFDTQLHASAENNGPNGGPFSDFWYNDIPEESDSGIPIDEQSALRISTVWKCIDWYFRMFGHLPKRLMENTTLMGRSAAVQAREHHLFDIVHTAPNPSMSSALFFGLAAVDMKLAGNFYAFIKRFPNGRPQYLFRIAPSFMTVEDQRINGRKQRWYIVAGDNGIPVKFYPDEILHVRGLGDDLTGYSPIKLQMQLLGWNRATARYGGQFFKNASRPSGLVSLTNPIKPEKKTELENNLRAAGKDAGKMVLVEGAATFTKMTLDADEAQFIATYEHQEEDIAGVMGVSPHEIGINRNINNSITEQQTINSVTRFLTPFCVLFEQAMNQQLLSDVPSSGRGGGTERERYFFHSELKGLLRGDTAAQKDLLVALFDRGINSGNDCADYLGQPPYEGGDIRVVNAAYVPLEDLKEIAKKRGTAPGAPNSAGSTPPTENHKQEASVSQIFGHVFRDCVGRVVSRKKDREKSVVSIFMPVMLSIAEALGVASIEPDYFGALALRSSMWNEAHADAISEEELKRYIAAITENES